MLIDALATARLTRLITEDAITEPLRDKIMGRWPDSKLSYFVTCTACTSVWAAAAVLVVPRNRRWVVRMLALSELAIMAKRIDG